MARARRARRGLGRPRRAASGKSLAEGHRESVIDLAELAWGEGALLDSDADADAWPAVAGSLLFVDELERAVEIAQTAARLADRHLAVPAPATITRAGASITRAGSRRPWPWPRRRAPPHRGDRPRGA